MNLGLKLALLAFTCAGTFAHADVACPWEKLSGQDLLSFSYSDNVNRDLTSTQIQEDLACLKILFENKYVALDAHPEVDLVSRLNKLSREASAMKSSQLLELIYAQHHDLPDVHLVYKANGVQKTYSGENKKEVSLSENLETEKVFDRGSYVYFKPAPILTPQLTEAQGSFLEIIKTSDRNLVLDLRETYGGGGIFSKELAKHLYSATQKIPQAKSHQVVSGLSYIGLAVTATIVYQDQVKDFVAQLMSAVKDKKLNELISYKIEEKSTKRIGERATPYKSKIVLLIDGTCGSECETVVELLSAHPNATVIGQNTKGALHFSNAMSFTLPNSGIWVRIPSLRHIVENDAIEGVGYAPTIRTDFVDLNKLVF